MEQGSVPDFVGMEFRAARRLAAEARIILTGADPDGPPIGALAWPGVHYIRSQQPEAGARIEVWGTVIVELSAGDGDQPAFRLPDGPPPELRAQVIPEAERLDESAGGTT